MLDTLAIENFISVQETEGPKLATALEEHVKQYDVDIMNLQRGEALIPASVVACRKCAWLAAPRSRPRMDAISPRKYRHRSQGGTGLVNAMNA